MASPYSNFLENNKTLEEAKASLRSEAIFATESWPPQWSPGSYFYRPGRVLARLKSVLRPKSPPEAAKLRSTAWLDGLRGFAAFLVYWHHHQLWVHDVSGQNTILENGFGYEGNYHLVSFPGLRHFFSGGHFAVSTFFVISGYVLSMKPLGLIHSGDFLRLGENISSALFRRWFRLFIPLIVTVFVYLTASHAFGIWIRGTKQQGSWCDEISAFYIEFKNFSFVYREGGLPWLTYHFHLWSIPVEFKGSIVVYTTLLALSRSSHMARLWCQAGLIFYFMYIADGWYCAMFIGGMLLCDLEQLSKKDELPGLMRRLRAAKSFIFYHLLLFSLFLGGVPCENREVDQLRKSRGWFYLSYLKPQAVFDYKWFYLFWAAMFLVASVPHIKWLKRFFETKFCQYLGRISFALYMVHGPVLWTLGDRLYVATGWQTEEHLSHIPHWVNKFPLPRNEPVGLELALLLPQVILLPATLCLAELVTRSIDAPSVRFASWLYRTTLGDSPGKQAKA